VTGVANLSARHLHEAAAIGACKAWLRAVVNAAEGALAFAALSAPGHGAASGSSGGMLAFSGRNALAVLMAQGRPRRSAYA